MMIETKYGSATVCWCPTLDWEETDDYPPGMFMNGSSNFYLLEIINIYQIKTHPEV